MISFLKGNLYEAVSKAGSRTLMIYLPLILKAAMRCPPWANSVRHRLEDTIWKASQKHLDIQQRLHFYLQTNSENEQLREFLARKNTHIMYSEAIEFFREKVGQARKAGDRFFPSDYVLNPFKIGKSIKELKV